MQKRRFWQICSKAAPVGLKVLLPVVALATSLAAAKWMIDTKPKPPQADVQQTVPAVTAVEVQRRSVCFPIRSQGTVQPRRESTLAARVSGQVEWVADCFDESGFFRQGQVLVRIDRRDHLIRVQRLEAALRSAVAHQTESEQDLSRLLPLMNRGATTKAAVDQAKARAEMATAAVDEINAQLAEARYAEADTEIKAPFDGCIQEKCVEVGQFVTVGTKLASCFATDAVEVRLPISDDEFAFLGLPLGQSFPSGRGPAVELTADFAGQRLKWYGTIVRSEAIVDSRSRMVFLVAQVKDPYADIQSGHGQPLAVGMFVEGAVRCCPICDAIVLPESCIDSRGELLAIDEESRLEFVKAEVLRRGRGWVVVRAELADGSEVCSTRLEGVVPGMAVQIVGDAAGMTAEMTRGGVMDLSAGTVVWSTRRRGDQP
jgi:RND family efflux transporter MFP subunit